MILYVNGLLAAWGRWAVRGHDGGLGWASVSPMFKDVPAGVAYGSKAPLGVGQGAAECEVTDQAVQRLSPADRLICVEVYQVGGKTVEIARRLGCARETVSRRLSVVHQRVKMHIEDIELDC